MHHRQYEADSILEVWQNLLEDLVDLGDARRPRNLETLEILGVTLRVDSGLSNIFRHPGRDLNYKFMVAEWLWIMSGSDNLHVIAQYNGNLTQFSDDGVRLAGAYGPRLMPQWEWLKAKLKDSDTRQAVATIWTACPVPSKDIPCTVALQFLRRDDSINLIVTMRSSDVWLGLPYDFFVFSQVLNCMCGELGCVVGFVQFNLGSSHLYKSNLEAAKRLINGSVRGYTIVSPRLTGRPPEAIFQTLMTQDGLTLFSDEAWRNYNKILVSPRANAYDILTT